MRSKDLKDEVVIDAIWDGLELTYTIRTQMDDGDGKTIDDLDYLSIPFFPKPCLILIGLITIRKRTVKTWILIDIQVNLLSSSLSLRPLLPRYAY